MNNPPAAIPEERAQVLLRRVVELYHQNFSQSLVPRQWLASRGLTDCAAFERFQVGWSDGRLPKLLPDGPGVRRELADLGLLDAKGREVLTECVIFPTSSVNGRIDNLWAYPPAGQPRLLPQRAGGCWNLSAARASAQVLVVADVIDALSLVVAGYGNVLALDPAIGTIDPEVLRTWGVQRMTVLHGDTPEARSAATVVITKFRPLPCGTAVLHETKGANAKLVAKGPKILAETVAAATAGLVTTTIPGLQPLPDGFSLPIGNRRYEVRGLERSLRHLKATIRAERGGRLHVDVIDFYVARGRRQLVQGMVRLFDESADLIESDVAKLLIACEARVAQPDLATPAQVPDPIPEADRKEAETFGCDPKILDVIADDFARCGIVGEQANQLLCYLVMTSRKLSRPLSVMNLSCSGAGKSTLQDAVLAFCPPEDLIKITHLSGKALFHKERSSLKHKVLAIEEDEGARSANYALRNLISAGELTTEVTTKDPASGRLITTTNKVEGPAAVFVTTTAPDLDAETRSRFFVTSIDESREQTRAILERQRQAHTLAGITDQQAFRDIRRRHHAFQRLLQPLHVVNPAATQLGYRDDRLSSRRDQPKLLRLIEAIAFLRQMQKPVRQHGAINYIEVDEADLRAAARLMRELSGRMSCELSPPSKKLLQELDRMRTAARAALSNPDETVPPPFYFTRQQVRDFVGWSEATLHRHLKELLRFEHVILESGSRCGPHRYRLYWQESGADCGQLLLFPFEAARPVTG
jgi:DNA primase